MLRHLALFLLIGCLLYGGEQVLLSFHAAAEADSNVVRIRQQTLQELKVQFNAATGRLPSEAELEQNIRAYVDSEILISEAIKLGIHIVDPVVQQRLVLNMQFLEQEGTDAELVERALALNMVYTDRVVRRRLIERMEKIIASQMPSVFSEEELKAFWLQNDAFLQRNKQWKLFHVVFNKSDFSQGEVEAIYAKWQAGDMSAAELSALATNQFTQDHMWYSEKNISQLFSPFIANHIIHEQAAQGSKLPLQSSVTGYHFVQILDKRLQSKPDFDLVRGQVEHAYRLQQQETLISNTLQQLRNDYSIVREG